VSALSPVVRHASFGDRHIYGGVNYVQSDVLPTKRPFTVPVRVTPRCVLAVQSGRSRLEGDQQTRDGQSCLVQGRQRSPFYKIQCSERHRRRRLLILMPLLLLPLVDNTADTVCGVSQHHWNGHKLMVDALK